MLHKLLHLFGWNHGKVITIRINSSLDDSWIGFQCDVCGNISGLEKSLGPTWEVYNTKRIESENTNVAL